MGSRSAASLARQQAQATSLGYGKLTELVAQFDQGMVLEPAVKYQRLAQTAGTPRDNH